ncbi:beta-lactamase family protein [Kineosporia sp. J2-2]|uniref:Beta-lactamase family protein n=1 Tax=Kineosporia corallincola TaxID=2835133 RepID=A0ABS5TND5_9ACTN|nr:serine hydrolase domain-containing protein [Kineosporia corallincola]MBT0771568.1 beta-lactamase family protein [Kineosporia corallincola]
MRHSHPILLRAAVAGIGTALVLGTGTATAATRQAGRAATHPFTAELQRTARAVVAAGGAGYLARADDGTDILTATAGLADPATGRRMKNKDQYEAGSQTKTFVSVLVLQLVAEGTVQLDSPVETYLPGVVPNGQNITVRMLLQHTSGLFNYTDDSQLVAAALADPHRVLSPQQILRAAFQHDAVFEPGTSWAYSNTGYIVLGELLKKVTGESVGALIDQRIAKPLRLGDTYLADPFVTDIGPGFAHGHLIDFTADPPSRVDVADWTLSWAGSAGALVSTARDLSDFYTALLGGDLLPAAQLAEMRRTVDVPDGFGGYGLGLIKVTTACGTVWGHGGDTVGHHTTTLVTADGSRSVATDTSSEPGEADENDAELETFVRAVTEAEFAALCAMTGQEVPSGAAVREGAQRLSRQLAPAAG